VLALWSGLALVSMLQRMAGPVGLRIERPVEMRGALGLPLDGAQDVTALRALLGSTSADTLSRLLVVYPSDTDPVVLGYVHEQLAHILYPQQVEVIDTRAKWSWVQYGALITARGLRLRELEPVAQLDGLAMYRRPTL
jgi:hypothetical protein